MCQFTPGQSLLDLRIWPQEKKPDPEVSLKQDDLYARTWKCENEKPILDAHNANTTPSNSPEDAVQSDLSNEETCNTPGTAQECSRENFPQMEVLCDVTDTNSYIEPDA